MADEKDLNGLDDYTPDIYTLEDEDGENYLHRQQCKRHDSEYSVALFSVIAQPRFKNAAKLSQSQTARAGSQGYQQDNSVHCRLRAYVMLYQQPVREKIHRKRHRERKKNAKSVVHEFAEDLIHFVFSLLSIQFIHHASFVIQIIINANC